MSSRAIFDFPLEGTRFIEASAGTGKTYTISNLYLRLLLGHGASKPFTQSEILVLTFTRAATRDLRIQLEKRIETAIKAFSGGNTEDEFLNLLVDSTENKERSLLLLTSALHLMDEAAIFTIHGFCAKTLRENSLSTDTLIQLEPEMDSSRRVLSACEDFFRTELSLMEDDEYHRFITGFPSPHSLFLIFNSWKSRPDLILSPPPEDISVNRDELEKLVTQVKKLWIQDKVEELMRQSGVKGNSRPLTGKGLDSLHDFLAGETTNHPEWSRWTTDTILASMKANHSPPNHPVFAKIDRIFELQPVIENMLLVNVLHRAYQWVNNRIDSDKRRNYYLTMDDLTVKLEYALAGNRDFSRSLSKKYPVALVDEFQDTDPVQYRIFEHLKNSRKENINVFVGDPKQAIYAFRGADVYTYINARNEVEPDNIHRLSVNWRSNPLLVDAANKLFSTENLFDLKGEIIYEPVSASPGSEKRYLISSDQILPPLVLCTLETKDKFSKSEARELLCEYTAEQISGLLQDSNEGKILLEGESIRPHQISVLVRDRIEAALVKKFLLTRNLRSVYLTQESVFQSETALDLYNILCCIAEINKESSIRSALATPLMQHNLSEIIKIDRDPGVYQTVLEEFLIYQKIWLEKGIASMISELIARRNLGGRWLGQLDGERRLTDLRQLSELLQNASLQCKGMHTLIHWLGDQINNELILDEDRQMRMESEKDLISIVTIHASKGLEYDVVFIPSASFTIPKSDRYKDIYHARINSKYVPIIDLVMDKGDASWQASRQEMLNENTRLLYVAITRAKSRCYLGISNCDEDSAIARALAVPDQLDTPAKVGQYLQDNYNFPLFEVHRLTEIPSVTKIYDSYRIRNLVPPSLPPKINKDWTIYSYSRLAANLEKSTDDLDFSESLVPGLSDDERHQEPASTPFSGVLSRNEFPKGKTTGLLLHNIMEFLLGDSKENAVEKACEQLLDRYGFSSNTWSRIVTNWINDVLTTPLDGNNSIFLGNLQHVLSEMEFHFPIYRHTDIREMASLLYDSGYLSHPEINMTQFKGMMTGFIDLVFSHNGTFYLADYKSNYLGSDESAYLPASLETAMNEHNYKLQLIIYTVALHKYLSKNLLDYDYRVHFGGSFYLFLRGMNGNNQNGIYHNLPDWDLVQALEKLFEPKTEDIKND